MDYPTHSKAVELEAFLRSAFPETTRLEKFADEIEQNPKTALESYAELIDNPHIRGAFIDALRDAGHQKDPDFFIDTVWQWVRTSGKRELEQSRKR